MKKYSYPSVLTIAGFDSSGGAGIQADIKTISALGCFATTVLTALPVQNTTGVKSIYSIPDTVVEEQLYTVLDDIFPNAIKIGMVHSCGLVDTIVHVLKKYPRTNLVFDPVMVATSGHKLIEDKTIQSIVEQLFPLADIITPNLDEAVVLAQMPIETVDDMYIAGEKIKALGCNSLLLKGGHLKSKELTSLYFSSDGKVHEYHSEKYETNNTHGSGCTLSSAIASYLARGTSFLDAVISAQDYVQQAIFHGKDVQTGKGNGPLNHFFNPQKLIKNELVR
ncbi:MAG: bifunctional hydroxymethylpyrimidine kinase/phosphomethylpyrimidine kinase [Tannerellaceae bacterium]|jgi:hydroxymethylpyrimidine/phosphomethylpyrimidine kinase|nr:bifunctional hydroxymethylpyrimidine kinase/phosphomethylpyrimidine kinase [Tannerellaceae bacterium]